MQSHKRRRAPRTTIAQYALMLEFFTKHTILLNNRQTSSASAEDVDKLWKKLTTLLNNCGSGASKSVDQWKRTWVEWKSNTKRRCREELLDQKNCVKVRGLTELEQRLMDLLNSVTMIDNNHIEITSCKEEKNTSPLEVIEMLIEHSDSNNIGSNDFEHMTNNLNFNTETIPPLGIETPKDLSSACGVICNSLNGVALAIRELAASQCKMADANIKLAEVIIKQMEFTKK